MLLQTCCRRFAAARSITTMPLRAKVLNPAMTGNASRQYASASDIKELPGDAPDDVLFGTQGGIRQITLNRPKKLNSLDGSMIRKIIPRMKEWSKSDLANVVVIKGEGRAFCAGGDVASLAQQNKTGAEGQQASKDYFALEYKLDHLIATYKKPYIAFIDGITMGGGVGLSLHAPFRIATENTVFAMPETTIGFFPDVGASFFLPRMDGELGMYCALTSEQLKGPAVFYSGIATHYLHSSSLPDLETRLAELQFKDYDPLPTRLRIINSTIEEFATGLPHDSPVAAPIGGNIRAAIDYAFQPANDVTGILDALHGLEIMDTAKAGGQDLPAWAAKTRETILARSPTSVRVTAKLLRDGARWSIAETFRREHALAAKFMEHADFVEGVSALLIDKPKRKPAWQPATLGEISRSDVQDFFAAAPTLELLGKESGSTGEDYAAYPHAGFGLPVERDVQAAVSQGSARSQEEVVEGMVKRWEGKQGVREKVEEVLQRKTHVVGGGGVEWKQ